MLNPERKNKNIEPLKKSEIIDLILKSTVDLVGQYGYTLGTFERIAAHTGIKRGTVSYYYPQKETLLLCAAQHASELIDETIWSKLTNSLSLTVQELDNILNLKEKPIYVQSAHLFMMRLTLDLAAIQSSTMKKTNGCALLKALDHYHRRWHEIIKKFFLNIPNLSDAEQKVESILFNLNDNIFSTTLKSSIAEIGTLANFCKI